MATADGITFVNRFTLTGPAEEFERAFHETAAFMRRQPGLRGYTLSRAVDRPDQYVNIALWDSMSALEDSAKHPDFPSHVAALRAVATSESGFYAARQAFTAGQDD